MARAHFPGSHHAALLIIGHVPVMAPEPSGRPSGRSEVALEDRPNMIPEKKITAVTNTTPAMMPTQAEV